MYQASEVEQFAPGHHGYPRASEATSTVIVDLQLLGAGARNLSKTNGSQFDRHRAVPEDIGRRPAHERSRK
jgi:hypothetical protein